MNMIFKIYSERNISLNCHVAVTCFNQLSIFSSGIFKK